MNETSIRNRQHYQTPLALRIAIIFIIWLADVGAVYLYMHHERVKGTLLTLQDFSTDPGLLMVQNLIEGSAAIVILLLFLIVLKRDFFQGMYLEALERPQAVVVALLSAVLLIMTAADMVWSREPASSLYVLFYYLFFVSFLSELLFRGAMPYLLRENSLVIRYFLPNFLFGVSHLLYYAVFGDLTAGFAVYYILTKGMGYMGLGFFLQVIKERTGTIWIPILIHAVANLVTL